MSDSSEIFLFHVNVNVNQSVRKKKKYGRKKGEASHVPPFNAKYMDRNPDKIINLHNYVQCVDNFDTDYTEFLKTLVHQGLKNKWRNYPRKTKFVIAVH